MWWSLAMNHTNKVKHLLYELTEKGYNAIWVAPPFFRVLWKLGIKLPPPIFLHPLVNILIVGTYYTFGWAIIIWTVHWRYHHPSISTVVMVSVLAGLITGALYAQIVRWRARTLGLPPWHCYPPQG
jgi:hypothetical protein